MKTQIIHYLFYLSVSTEKLLSIRYIIKFSLLLCLVNLKLFRTNIESNLMIV